MSQEFRVQRIAEETSLPVQGVEKAIALFDAGAAVPFVAHYRRDETGNLNEHQLELIYESNQRYRSLADRRNAIIQTLTEQKKLTDGLREALEACHDKIELEDLYAPYRKRPRSKANVAVEKGLGPLADLLLAQSGDGPPLEELAQPFVRSDKVVTSTQAALDGAVDILTELFAYTPELRRTLRNRVLSEGRLLIHPTKTTEGKHSRYAPFFDTSEELAKVPASRFLAIMRGVRTAALRTVIAFDDQAAFEELAGRVIQHDSSPANALIREALRRSYDQVLKAAIERDVLTVLQERADAESIRVFRDNARNRLMAAPGGPVAVLGINTSAKDNVTAAGVDAQGALVGTWVIPVSESFDGQAVAAAVKDAVSQHKIKAVVVGRGDRLGDVLRAVRSAIEELGDGTCYCTVIQETGPVANDATTPGESDPNVLMAMSIARQHQDPLAELGKLDPRQIGIGQHHHEVNQKRLREVLQRAVSACVCRIGVDVNRAPAALLSYVCGIQPTTAENIVKRRLEAGPFTNRQQLSEVPGIGAKVFEQAAGFLIVSGGDNPLDATRIHPEAYAAVTHIAAEAGLDVPALIRNDRLLKELDVTPYQSETGGAIAADVVRHELINPWRDPRGRYRPPRFDRAVRTVADLEVGMRLEGVVTNVADFGVFVDVGVGQDGLVHLSELTNGFVRDPRRVARVGQTVTVKVLNVEKDKPRISLSIKALQAAKPKPRKRPEPAVGAETAAEKTEGTAAAPTSRPERDHREHRERRPNGAKPSGKSREKSRQSRDRGGRGPRESQPAIKQVSEPLANTQLADQLAAIRDRFGT